MVFVMAFFGAGFSQSASAASNNGMTEGIYKQAKEAHLPPYFLLAIVRAEVGVFHANEKQQNELLPIATHDLRVYNNYFAGYILNSEFTPYGPYAKYHGKVVVNEKGKPVPRLELAAASFAYGIGNVLRGIKTEGVVKLPPEVVRYLKTIREVYAY
jgi:hypothetical protein